MSCTLEVLENFLRAFVAAKFGSILFHFYCDRAAAVTPRLLLLIQISLQSYLPADPLLLAPRKNREEEHG